jgi:hypothetical protein
MMPVAARLVYVNRESRLNITSVLSEQVYPTRGKVTMRILTTGEDGQPVPANLGVTVFDKVFSNPLDSTNIVTHLHLSTQLKGRIYNPAYYFNSRSSQRDNALDLLMLTQGWRSYVWNEIDLKEHSDGQHLVVNDDISGKLAFTKTSKKVSPDQTIVFAFSPNKGEERVLIETDSAGNFIIPSGLMKIWEGDYVYLKPFGPPDVKFDIEFTEPFEHIGRAMEKNEILDPIPGLMKAKPAPLLPFDYRVIKVPEVTVTGSGNSAIRGKYMGMLDSIAKFSKPDYVCRNDILNCINHPAEPDNRTPVEGELYKIASSNGATTSIIYKLPNYTEEELLKMNNLWRIKAYYLTREFYQPVYDRDDDTALSVPDFRNTLLWEPMVITDENGEATLEFFCSDINALFDIRIEGITGDGLIGAGYYRLIVTKQSGQSR